MLNFALSILQYLQATSGKPGAFHVELCSDKSMVMSCGYLGFFNAQQDFVNQP